MRRQIVGPLFGGMNIRVLVPTPSSNPAHTPRVASASLGYERDMSTPPSGSPRLPDSERTADGDAPDLDRQNPVQHPSRIPDDEKNRRLPDPDE
jgi:hypothetical protein